MSKFRVGQKVFHVGLGIGVVVTVSGLSHEYPMAVTFGIRGSRIFTEDGKTTNEYTLPQFYLQLYTLEEARAMGFDVPKETVKKWRWVVETIAGRLDATVGHYTEEEAKVRFSPGLLQKIDATEIEAEEGD